MHISMGAANADLFLKGVSQLRAVDKGVPLVFLYRAQTSRGAQAAGQIECGLEE